MTAVQPVHLSRIGSLAAIEAAKGELVEALPRDGTAVLNADDRIVRRMAARTVARVVTYGFADDAEVRAEDVTSAGLDGMRFTLRIDGERRTAAIPALGRLSVHNAPGGRGRRPCGRPDDRRDRRPGSRAAGRRRTGSRSSASARSP